MAREVPLGAPSRSVRYVAPRSPWRPYLGLALTIGGAALLGGLWVAGTLSTAGTGDELRKFVWPGALSARHSTLKGCESCHVPRDGATNVRCQRCHDEAAPGRLTQTAHLGRHLVSLERRAQAGGAGSGHAGRILEDTTSQECVRCHLEHRGSSTDLRHVGEEQCLVCHADASRVTRTVTGFAEGEHPDHWVMDPAGVPREVATGMSQFSHDTHLRALAEDERGDPSSPGLCVRCHRSGPVEPRVVGDRRGLDFSPLKFETDCQRCHNTQLRVKVPTPIGYVTDRSDPGTKCAEGAGPSSGKHRDPWVLRNVRRLRYRLWPEAHLREYGALQRTVELLRLRVGQLTTPLQKRRREDLERLLETFRGERDRLEAALTRPRRDGDLKGRVEEIARALPAAEGDEIRAQMVATAAAPGAAPPPALESESLLDRIRRALGRPRPAGASPLSGGQGEFEARRAEVLLLLEALERARPQDARVSALRVRLVRLTPGELPAEGLRRALAERVEAIGRLEDELRLEDTVRSAGGVASDRESLQAKLDEAVAEVCRLDEAARTAPPDTSNPSARAGMEAVLAALTGSPAQSLEAPRGCAYCHEIHQGTFQPMRPAWRVLTAAEFRHEKHLSQGTCQECHGDLLVEPPSGEPSPAAAVKFARGRLQMAQLHLKPIALCHGCHGPRGQRQDCLECHRYHPPPS